MIYIRNHRQLSGAEFLRKLHTLNVPASSDGCIHFVDFGVARIKDVFMKQHYRRMVGANNAGSPKKQNRRRQSILMQQDDLELEPSILDIPPSNELRKGLIMRSKLSYPELSRNAPYTAAECIATVYIQRCWKRFREGKNGIGLVAPAVKSAGGDGDGGDGGAAAVTGTEGEPALTKHHGQPLAPIRVLHPDALRDPHFLISAVETLS